MRMPPPELVDLRPEPHGPHPLLGYGGHRVVDFVSHLYAGLIDLAVWVDEWEWPGRLAQWARRNCSTCPYCGAALLRPARFDEHVCR